MRMFGWGVITTLLAVNIVQYWYVANANQRGELETSRVEANFSSSLSRETTVVQAVQKVAPTVVAITTEVESQNPFHGCQPVFHLQKRWSCD